MSITITVRIPRELKEKVNRYRIKVSEVVRKALEREVEERTRKLLYEKAERASRIISKVRSEEWVKAIREGREAR